MQNKDDKIRSKVTGNTNDKSSNIGAHHLRFRKKKKEKPKTEKMMEEEISHKRKKKKRMEYVEREREREGGCLVVGEDQCLGIGIIVMVRTILDWILNTGFEF